MNTDTQVKVIEVPYHREKRIEFAMRRRWRWLPVYFLYARREESFEGGKLMSQWRGPFFGWQRMRAFMTALNDHVIAEIEFNVDVTCAAAEFVLMYETSEIGIAERNYQEKINKINDDFTKSLNDLQSRQD